MILINGIPAADYGITFEAGTLEELYKLPPMKGYASYGSRHINGKVTNASNRKVDSQEVQLPFVIQGSTRADYLTKLENVVQLFQKGKALSGVTELSYEGKTWKLIYIESNTLRHINYLTSKILVTFEEPNPSDR